MTDPQDFRIRLKLGTCECVDRRTGKDRRQTPRATVGDSILFCLGCGGVKGAVNEEDFKPEGTNAKET